MGIAEIQAALAANKPAANPFAAPAAPTPAPSPFGAPATAAPNPFGGSAPAPAFQPLPAPLLKALPAQEPAPTAQAAFAFNPPPGFNPASTPPINPPGERESLNSVGATGAPAALATDVADPASLGPQPQPETKRRGRKPKADAKPEAPLMQAISIDELEQIHAAGHAALQSPAEVVLSSISTEDLVALLRDRGYTVILESKA